VPNCRYGLVFELVDRPACRSCIQPFAFRNVVVDFKDCNRCPCRRLNDHRLATTACVPSALVCFSSPSHRPVRSNSALISSSGLGKAVRSRS